MIEIGKEIWLVGKGPSLDIYDWSKANKYRVCINETVLVIPEPYAVVATDYNVLDNLIKRPDVMENVYFIRKDDPGHRRYETRYIYDWKKGREVKRIRATAETALQICYYLGARIFHMVGFDSIDGNANYSLRISAIDAEGITDDKYEGINRSLLQQISNLNVQVIWEHRCI